MILSNNNLNLANNSQVLFNSLTNIKLLNLRFNFIEFIRANTFSNLFKLEVLDLSYNKIHSIKENSFTGLINLKDFYINANVRDIKIENSSFRKFEAIKTIFIDRSILNNSAHKIIFILMVKNRDLNHNKTILKWIYYPVFNLITLNESFYDCHLVYELIRFNIQYNLKTESDFSEYLANCQSIKLKRKDSHDFNIQDQKITINYSYMFLLMVCFLMLTVFIWRFFVFIGKLNFIQFLKAFILRLRKYCKSSVNFILNSINFIKDFLKRFW